MALILVLRTYTFKIILYLAIYQTGAYPATTIYTVQCDIDDRRIATNCAGGTGIWYDISDGNGSIMNNVFPGFGLIYFRSLRLLFVTQNLTLRNTLILSKRFVGGFRNAYAW